MEGIRIGIQDIKVTQDSSGHEYILYDIDITVSSPHPFHGWHIYRRYTDFVNLYHYMTTKSDHPRQLSCHIHSPSTTTHLKSFLNPLIVAKKRIIKLQQYLNELISLPNLTIHEIEIIKTFLNYEQYEIFLDEYRNRSYRMVTHDDIERSILNIENIKQVNRVLFLENSSIEASQQQEEDLDHHQLLQQALPSYHPSDAHHDLDQLIRTPSSTTSNTDIDRLCSTSMPLTTSNVDISPSRHDEQRRKQSDSCYSEDLDPEQSAIWRTVCPDPNEPPTPPSKPRRSIETPHDGESDTAPTPPRGSDIATSQSKIESSPKMITNSQSLPISSQHQSKPSPISPTSHSLSFSSSNGFIYPPTSDGLKEAIRNNDLKIIKQILKSNPALATFCDSQGNPIIYTCALYNNIPIALLLIDYGADPYTVNMNGLSAFDIGTTPWKTQILEKYLQKKSQLDRLHTPPELQYIKVNLKKTASGIGLKLGKNPNGKAIILGFKSPTKEMSHKLEESPTIESPHQILKICDLIHLIDGKEMKDLNEVIKKVKECEVNETLEVTILRATDGEEKDH